MVNWCVRASVCLFFVGKTKIKISRDRPGVINTRARPSAFSAVPCDGYLLDPSPISFSAIFLLRRCFCRAEENEQTTGPRFLVFRKSFFRVLLG